MPSTLSLDLGANVDNQRTALLELQRRVDGVVAPQTPPTVTESGGTASVVLPDAVASEQVLALYNMVVNMAGLPGGDWDPASLSLTGTVTPGTRQRTYSV